MAAPLESNSFTRALNHPLCDDRTLIHKMAPLLDKRSALIVSNAIFASPQIKNLAHKANLKRIYQDISKQHLKKIPDNLSQDLVDAIETTNRYVLSQLLNQCPDASVANSAFFHAAAIGDIEGMKIIIKSLGMYEAANLDFHFAIGFGHIDAIEFLMDPENDIPMNIAAANRGIYQLFIKERQESIKKVLFHNKFPAIRLIISASNLMNPTGVEIFYKFLDRCIGICWKIERNSCNASFQTIELFSNATWFNCHQILIAAIENFPDEMTDSEEKALRYCAWVARNRGQYELAYQIHKKLSKTSSCAD